MRLFQEEWLRDLSDRWDPFSAVLAEKQPAEGTISVLPLVLPEFQSLLFAIRRCAISSHSRPASNLQISDDERLGELRKQGFQLLRSSGDGNNCLVHSLALVLAAANVIRDLDEPTTACQEVRQHLIRTPGLHPQAPGGLPDPGAYLEHGRHGPCVVQRLLEAFAMPGRPDVNVRVLVHARYDTAGSPPDDFEVPSPSATSATRVFHLWNWTGDGTSGYHYDGLVLKRR